MSIRAMNWAMGARTDGVSAQCVLLVVADTANEHGVSIHADPDYIAERTRQSRATVFRRLNELEAAGALTRLKRYRDDGAPVYEIKLHINADVDYDRPPGGEGDPQDAEPKSQIETPPESQPETPKVSPVRQAESQSCDSKSPSKNPVRTPNPLSGGVRADEIDQELEPDVERFRAKYPAPITNLPRLRTVLAAMTAPERAQVLTAVDGYASFIHGLERKGKARAVKDADRWVSGGLWQGFVTSGEQAQANAQRQTVAADSPEGRAWRALHRIAGLSEPFGGNGQFYLPGPLSAQALALADSPPESAWIFIGVESANQVGAWDELVSRELRGRARPPIVNDRNREHRRGFKAPWPWPPLKDGTVKTGPPHQDSINEQDDHPLKIGNEGKQC